MTKRWHCRKNHQTRLDGRLRRTGRNGFSPCLRTQDIPPHRIARLRKSSGNMVLGTAEGGKKITLYNVNDLNIKKINIESSTSIILKRCIMSLPISCIRNGISTLLSTASRKENTWSRLVLLHDRPGCHAPHGRCGLVRRFRDGLCHEPVQRGFCGKI